MHPLAARDDLDLPDSETLLADLAGLASRAEPVARCLAATQTGHFQHPDGRSAELCGVTLAPIEAALIVHLCRSCPTPLTVEAGFGMGSSATIIMATRRLLGAPFEHRAYDPSALLDGRGALVASYLMTEFGDRFRLVRELSQVGLAKLIDERGTGSVGLAFIDGSHHCEHVMADFVLADMLCSEGGAIIFHDALFPAIATVISYIACNRPDYAVGHLPGANIAAVQKRGPDRREWSSFAPFPVPDRHDWTRVD
jgi:predicted O-methyltransferase YrrM